MFGFKTHLTGLQLINEAIQDKLKTQMREKAIDRGDASIDIFAPQSRSQVCRSHLRRNPVNKYVYLICNELASFRDTELCRRKQSRGIPKTGLIGKILPSKSCQIRPRKN